MKLCFAEKMLKIVILITVHNFYAYLEQQSIYIQTLGLTFDQRPKGDHFE